MKRMRYALVFFPIVLSGHLAFAQTTTPLGMFAFLEDPTLFAAAVTAVATWLVELITDALKDRAYSLRGWQTRLVAGAVAALLAGGGGYFGLSYFAALSGWQGAPPAAGMALSSWLFADLKHRAGQLRKTGQRHDKRVKGPSTPSWSRSSSTRC